MEVIEYEGTAYLCGREGFKQGLRVTENPYRQDSKDSGEWIDGWLDEQEVGGRRADTSGETSEGRSVAERHVSACSAVRQLSQPQKHAQSA